MKINISAPGKTILHGEHAVVYGKAAIAVSLSLKTRLTLLSLEEDKVILDLKKLGVTKEWNTNDLNTCIVSCSELGAGEILPANEECLKEIESFIPSSYSESEKLALATFLYLWIHVTKSYNIGAFPSCHISIDSDLSIGSGMGSSASYCVCLSAAILILCGRITPSLLSEDKELINKWAFQAEKIFHGKPSGIDNAICTFGGALLFEKGEVVDRLSDMRNLDILLVDTKVQRNTKALVEAVKNRQQLYNSVIDSVLEAIDDITSKSWKILKQLNNTGVLSPRSLSEKLEPLLDLIVMNQHLLNCLGAGHEKLNQIFDIAQSYSCPAKLTGAGGGGCAFILVPPHIDPAKIDVLKKELESHDFKVWNLYLGDVGVQVEFENA